VVGNLEDFEGQSGLAHTRLAGNENEPADAGKGLIEGTGQPAQRLLTAD
jgi:hypothetical protein